MTEHMLHCSFCGVSQNGVLVLIAAQSGFICDKCVSVCNEIVLDHKIDDRARKLIQEAKNQFKPELQRSSFWRLIRPRGAA